MHSCCCTAQCKTCGACCQVGCACRYQTYTVPQTTPPPPLPWPPGQITQVTPPLTEEQVRRIIREEIDRGR